MQKLVLLNTITLETIKANLRIVNLLQDISKLPYKDAEISLKDFCPNDLKPAAFYILEEQKDTHRAIRNIFLQKYALDILKLQCGLVYRCANQIYTMYPPIIEEFNGGCIILDGLHRVALARELKTNITCIFISSVSFDCPFPCLPLEWEQVTLVQVVPRIKRLPRRPDAYYSLHRNLNIFNLGGSRQVGAKI